PPGSALVPYTTLFRSLLSREVFDGFSAAVSERESKGEQIDQSFVGINKADIVEAEMKGGIANISVRFLSQPISATRDRGGNVISDRKSTRLNSSHVKI